MVTNHPWPIQQRELIVSSVAKFDDEETVWEIDEGETLFWYPKRLYSMKAGKDIQLSYQRV